MAPRQSPNHLTEMPIRRNGLPSPPLPRTGRERHGRYAANECNKFTPPHVGPWLSNWIVFLPFAVPKHFDRIDTLCILSIFREAHRETQRGVRTAGPSHPPRPSDFNCSVPGGDAI